MTDSWFTERNDREGLGLTLRVSEKLLDEQTPYQHLEVYQTTRWGRLMVLDGYVMLTSRDNFTYHEMMSHPVLYTHPDPRRVLIIGGGDCGTLREVLKHPGVERCVQVDIDERVTRASERFFPELCTANSDPRAELLFADGVAYVKALAENSFDVVIVDSTDPQGPAVGLFGQDFMGDVRRALGGNGIMVQQSESPILHLQTILADVHRVMRAAGYGKVATLQFPVVGYPSGWWSATMASCRTEPLTRYRREDAERKPFETVYYNAAMHGAALAVPEFCKPLLTDQ